MNPTILSQARRLGAHFTPPDLAEDEKTIDGRNTEKFRVGPCDSVADFKHDMVEPKTKGKKLCHT